MSGLLAANGRRMVKIGSLPERCVRAGMGSDVGRARTASKVCNRGGSKDEDFLTGVKVSGAVRS